MSEKHVVCPLGICLQQQLQDLLDNKDIQIANLREELAARNSAISAERVRWWAENLIVVSGIRHREYLLHEMLLEAGVTVEGK